jgi:hypothetical protein
MLVSNDPTLVNGTLANGQAMGLATSFDWALGSDPAAVADGPHTVYAQWQDSLGVWSAVRSATISVDRTAPTVAAPYPALVTGTTLSATGISIDFVANATDSGSGVAGTSALVARNGGTWSALPQDLVPSATDMQIDRTSTWQLQSTAVDAVGNQSAPVTGSPFHMTALDDSSPQINYSYGWTRALSAGANGGYVHYATIRKPTAAVTFTGSSVAWVAAVGPTYGRARVYVDGVYAGCIDLGRPLAAARQVVFAKSWATSGQHRIKITVLATPGRPKVDVDAFVVLG